MFRIFRKLAQIWRDHEAMEAMRANRGDVYFISYVGQGTTGFECYVNQRRTTMVSDEDPAEALLQSLSHARIQRHTNMPSEPILTTTQCHILGCQHQAPGLSRP